MIKIKFPSIKTQHHINSHQIQFLITTHTISNYFTAMTQFRFIPLTNFDRSRVTYNLAKNPFIIDFIDITCDLSISQMTIDALPLSCAYSSTVLSCELSTPSDISSLSEQSYDIYNTSYLFHQISLINCTAPESKIDAVNGVCLSSCGDQNKVDYNNECISECPNDTGT